MLGIIMLIFVVLSTVAKSISVLSFISKRKSIINIFSVVTILFIFDIDLPMIYYLMTGEITTLYYYPIFTAEEYYIAYLALMVGYYFFVSGYLFTVRKDFAVDNTFLLNSNQVLKLKEILIILILLYLLGVAIDIKNIGGWNDYYNYKILRIISSRIQYSSSIEQLISNLASFSVSPIILLTLLIQHNETIIRRKMAFLLVGIIMAIFTFSRGTLLSVAIQMILLNEGKDINWDRLLRIGKRVLIIGAIAFMLFTGIRTVMISNYWDNGAQVVQNQNIIVYSLHRLLVGTLGSSLNGMTRIVHYLRMGGTLFNGRSILELSYRFIPRSIWPDKPLNYGIQSINEVLGTPSSTMDAISLSGELVANFDFWGLLLIPLYGFLAGITESERSGKYFKYVYVTYIFGAVSTTFWMATTGLMTFAINMVAFYILIRFVYSYLKPLRFVLGNNNLKISKY